MEANELRIGNLVYTGKISVPRIGLTSNGNTKITGHGISLVEQKILDVEPIPLTEQWLLDFGFKMNETKSKSHGNFYSMSYLDLRYSFCYADFRKDWGFYITYTDSPDPKDDNAYYFVSCGIKHVHQLQNLYFALTGKELTK